MLTHIEDGSAETILVPKAVVNIVTNAKQLVDLGKAQNLIGMTHEEMNAAVPSGMLRVLRPLGESSAELLRSWVHDQTLRGVVLHKGFRLVPTHEPGNEPSYIGVATE